MSQANEPEPPATAKPKAPRCRKRRQRRKRQIAYLAICSLSVAVFGLALATLIRPAAAADADAELDADASNERTEKKGDDNNPQVEWRAGYAGHGTTHEQMGELHWAPVDYTPYKPTVNYTRPPTAPTTAMNPIFNFTHKLYDSIISDEPALPPGYIVMQGDSLALGPKFHNADFRDLIARYWLVLLFILFLCVIIVVMPFVAVCYCCLCCCRRCRQGCPPCTSKQDAQRRLWCGVCLLILIVGLIFGIVIAFVTNRLLDRGFDQATVTMKRGSDDICLFLKDVADHVHHLMVYNYEEMQTHISDELSSAHKHIFLDLADTSESTSLGELERILHNMPEARLLMEQVAKMETDLRFYGAQLRDGLRGMKRDINFAVANLCTTQECQTFLSSSSIELIDTSKCLHFDTIPNATLYLEGLNIVVKENYIKIPTDGLTRMENVSLKVKEQLNSVTPSMIRDLNGGRDTFRSHARRIRNQVDAVLSQIHLKTSRSSRSFDDVYDKFGNNRSVISVIVCLLMIMILGILIVSLLCGCFGRRKTGYRDDCCSKATAANCLFLAILLIFCMISFITLMGLVYFMIGLVTYQGACAPLRDVNKNALFRQLDSMVDLNRYLPRADDAEPLKAAPPLRMSNALKMCEANQSVFDMLRANRLYDINELKRIKVMSSEEDSDSTKIFDEDMSKTELLTQEEFGKLEAMRQGGAADYHSELFKDLCSEFTPVNLNALGEKMYALSNSLESPTFGWARVSFWNEGLNAKSYYQNFIPKLTTIVEKMKSNMKRIDELILYENRDFNNSIRLLLKAVRESQTFIQTKGTRYINELGKNLTSTISNMIDEYISMVIDESNENVGRCEPLAYIYHQGVDLVCRSMVDPINGYWVGVLLCALLFLPILYVSHRLMCLYKKVYPYMASVASHVDVVYEGGSERLYDAYSEREREHVPLANVPKKRRKAYERRREQQEYYEDASPSVSRATRSGGGGGGGGAGGDGAPGSSSMRYNDMAPTHWDHEPPRYHNPPAAPPSSEYERPPPYYYPGASEQD
ncbi:prominin-like protein isoform X1 [Drosophila persimilis]|uniref:prominin-like protein isoform X1 n=1 Tax=Drosophila persimilis TaxID=7234 RepID=UPI000F082B9C|nr:prominin-like protein isoform X1 [Drosophila persimilis]XP_026847519.1 prominin-like protein isoform X1 [Drosophila persimilis]XP_026847520.1 prominin-like protein isoform X1 [Drosophila persimilis]XP_026847521.1 prominin-like protein isoform X1 [Drosophila persimilis]